MKMQSFLFGRPLPHVDENKYGRHSDRVQYLLKNKVTCANGQEKLKCRIKPSNQCKIILAKKEVATGVTSRST